MNKLSEKIEIKIIPDEAAEGFLGAYSIRNNVIIIEEKLLAFPDIYQRVLKHEMTHAEISLSDKSFLRKTWMNLCLEYEDIPENAEILITLNNKKRKPLSIKDAVMNLIINLGRIPGDLLCMFLVFGLRVTNWIHRAR